MLAIAIKKSSKLEIVAQLIKNIGPRIWCFDVLSSNLPSCNDACIIWIEVIIQVQLPAAESFFFRVVGLTYDFLVFASSMPKDDHQNGKNAFINVKFVKAMDNRDGESIFTKITLGS